MIYKQIIPFAFLSLTFVACDNLSDKTIDSGFDNDENLRTLKAGIWIDPRGCQHWIIDDGVEGYLSARLDPKGKPVCTPNVAPPSTVVGDFKRGHYEVLKTLEEDNNQVAR